MEPVHDGLDDLEHSEGGDAITDQRAKDAASLQLGNEVLDRQERHSALTIAEGAGSSPCPTPGNSTGAPGGGLPRSTTAPARPRTLTALRPCPDPAVAHVVALCTRRHVPGLDLRQVVVLGGEVDLAVVELEQVLQLPGHERCVVRRNGPVLLDVGVQAVEPPQVLAQDLPLGAVADLGVAPLLADLVGNLEAPEGLQLPLGRSVPERVRSEDDLILALEREELADDVGPERRERDDRACEGGPQRGI